MRLLKTLALVLSLGMTGCAPAAAPSLATPPTPTAAPAAQPAASPAAAAASPAASSSAGAPPPVLSEGSAPAASTAASNRDALIEGARKEGKFVLYTSAPEQLATKVLENFKAKYPFLDVSEFYRNTSGRVQAKLQAEMDAGQNIADVFNNANVGTFLELKEKQKLAEFVTPEQDQYVKELKDPGYWTVWRLSAIIMGYNPSKIPEAELPTSWSALTDPKFAGKVGFEDSTSGTQHMQWYVLRQVMGPDFWSKVGQNGAVAFAGSTPIVEGVLRGELLLAGETYGYHVFNFGEMQKAPFRGIYPQEGVPLGINPIAVLEDAPHPNAARLFMDWILSAEGQQVVVDVVGDYSARDDVPSPAGNPKWNEVKKLYPDSYESLSKSQTQFIDEWNAITKKQG